MALQTILGAGGTIGTDLARILPEYADRVRLVSRTPEKVVASNEVHAADLTDARQVIAAVEGSEVVYLVAGLPYKTKVWRAIWPTIMRNTIDACKAHGARLVFFDNLYMYDRDCLDQMDESTPIRPTSGKGTVRAEIAQLVMDAHERGDIEALIARSADFYGPGKQQGSVLGLSVFERLAAGKPAQWLMSADHRHSFTYTPDASRATAMLGNAADTHGHVWHLPTAPNPPTGRAWVELVAEQLGAAPKLQVARPVLIAAMGLFVPPLRELREMAYQYDRDYVFLSNKFNRRFDFEPTPYDAGIRLVAVADYPQLAGID